MLLSINPTPLSTKVKVSSNTIMLEVNGANKHEKFGLKYFVHSVQH